MHRQSRLQISLIAAVLLSTVAFPASAQTRVANPFVGVTGYVNPDWAAKANAETGGSRISNQPTGIWMDQIAAIAGTGGAMGMRAHLDNALATGAGYIQFVIYDLPGRDCAALSSNGELGPTDIATYKSQFIDPIAAIETDSKYANIRIINIIEIDSLPNLVTNAGSQNTATAACATMLANGNYVTGVQYALSKLGNTPNIYNYVDAGHHGWLGWSSNFGPAATLFANTIKGATGGANTIAGLIANTANYSATTELYFTVNDSVNGTSVKSSKWVDYNDYIDEQSFGLAFVKQVGSLLGRSDLGLLIDTSRNGWGGTARPTGPGPTTSVDAYVDGSRIDRRIATGNWCNQSGAGLGVRPTAAPAAGVHAYVWIKPPGESDGSDHATTATRGLDGMCNPTYAGNARNNNNATGALANSPIAGQWFSAQFQQLMTNAYPPLSGGTQTCTTAPSAPASATATASGTTITLSWGSVTPPANCSVTYNVYRSTTNGFTPSSSNQIGSALTTTSSVSTGLTASTTYYFAVQAVDAAGNSAVVRASATTGTVSNTCAAVPPAVTTLTSNAVSSSQINLSWSAVTAPANCSVTYTVYRSTTNGFTPSSSNQIATGLTTTSLNDTGLAASTTYYYAVQATDSFGTAAVARVSGTTQTGSTTTFALTVTKSGTGAGTVTSSPTGINCGSTCTASFASTVTVTLTAAATSGTFTSWSGACSGTAATCTVAMSQARSVTATFTSGGTTTGPCSNPITLTSGNSGNFNTVGAACYRTNATVNGWGCYNMDGRTVSVNGTVTTCGAMPVAKYSDGYSYFGFTAGTYAWAGFYYW
jgi:cellulose 1,4-beta-cellobiosidase